MQLTFCQKDLDDLTSPRLSRYEDSWAELAFFWFPFYKVLRFMLIRNTVFYALLHLRITPQAFTHFRVRFRVPHGTRITPKPFNFRQSFECLSCLSSFRCSSPLKFLTKSVSEQFHDVRGVSPRLFNYRAKLSCLSMQSRQTKDGALNPAFR